MDVLTHKAGEARSRLALLITNTFGSNNTESRQTNFSKPVSTAYLPRPTDIDVGTSTHLDIRTTESSSKRSTNVTYYMGGKA